MKTTLSIFPVFALCVLINSCVSDEKPSNNSSLVIENVQPSQKKNINISILLDLSDRINPEKSPHLGVTIVDRDLGYIKTISEAFESHLKSNRIRATNDHIQVFFEPEPMNPKINILAKDMKLSFTKKNLTNEAIQKIVPDFQKASSEIYKLALKDKKFVGSDIWTFFKSKAKDYCIRPNQRNILIILTDGYMLHIENQIRERNQTTYLTTNLIQKLNLNDSQYEDLIKKNNIGFIPATKDLGDLEVLVLGIDAVKGRKYEEDVIKKYWEDWFRAMGVKIFDTKAADLPNNLEPVIRKFITQESI